VYWITDSTYIPYLCTTKCPPATAVNVCGESHVSWSVSLPGKMQGAMRRFATIPCHTSKESHCCVQFSLYSSIDCLLLTYVSCGNPQCHPLWFCLTCLLRMAGYWWNNHWQNSSWAIVPDGRWYGYSCCSLTVGYTARCDTLCCADINLANKLRSPVKTFKVRIMLQNWRTYSVSERAMSLSWITAHQILN
jgi:hypothetical protein